MNDCARESNKENQDHGHNHDHNNDNNNEQALELKPNYAMAFILKGSLVLAEGNLEEAPKLFLQANHIRKDIYSYKGEERTVTSIVFRSYEDVATSALRHMCGC